MSLTRHGLQYSCANWHRTATNRKLDRLRLGKNRPAEMAGFLSGTFRYWGRQAVYTLHMSDDQPPRLTIVSNNAKPEKPKSRVRMASNVSRYCQVCNSSTWIFVNLGPADVIAGVRPTRQRCCIYCLSKGKVTTW